MQTNTAEIRKLIDEIFALQWCRENIVVPLGKERNQATGSEKLTVAIGNFSYLGTIGDFIKTRVANAGLECQFIEKPAHEIQALLDQATQERLISGESDALDGIEFSDDAVLDALKGVEDENGAQGFDFDFDDSDEQIIEEEALDLSTEMLGNSIQRAAAKVLIHSARSDVSTYTLNREEMYQSELRKDGVMQSFISMPRSAGIKFTACKKHGTNGYCRKACISRWKDSKKTENQTMEFAAPARKIRGEDGVEISK